MLGLLARFQFSRCREGDHSPFCTSQGLFLWPNTRSCVAHLSAGQWSAGCTRPVIQT